MQHAKQFVEKSLFFAIETPIFITVIYIKKNCIIYNLHENDYFAYYNNYR